MSSVDPELSAHGRAIIGLSGGAPAPGASVPHELTRAVAAHLSEIGEHIEQTVAAVHARLEELSASLDELARRVEPSPPASPAQAVGDEPRLRAVEMAVAGATRGEVDASLAGQLADPQRAALLDDLFGAGTPAGARLPWGRA